MPIATCDQTLGNPENGSKGGARRQWDGNPNRRAFAATAEKGSPLETARGQRAALCERAQGRATSTCGPQSVARPPRQRPGPHVWEGKGEAMEQNKKEKTMRTSKKANRIAPNIIMRKRLALDRAARRLEARQRWRAAAIAAAAERDSIKEAAWKARKRNPAWARRAAP